MKNLQKCRLCDSTNLTDVLHTPRSSLVGLKIVQCLSCELVQGTCDDAAYSKQNDYFKDPALTLSQISCDSPYSNIRVGKQQMAEKFFNLFDTLPISLESIDSVLDLRCARGSFIKKAPEYFVKSSEFVGLEQDLYLHPSEQDLNDLPVTILDKSIYNMPKGVKTYDFIYSCHTLEHYRDPNRYIQSVTALLSPNGYFFLDVPCLLDFINSDILDDFFYDKHLLYFTEKTLSLLLDKHNFHIIWSRLSGNGCIEILAQLNSSQLKSAEGCKGEATTISSNQILEYSNRLSKNRSFLPSISDNITKYISASSKKNVAFGAGRILDAFKVYGSLNLSVFDFFIDNYLFEASRNVNGFDLIRIRDLMPEKDFNFIVFTRSKADSLTNLILTLYPNSTVIHWSEFMTNFKPQSLS